MIFDPILFINYIEEGISNLIMLSSLKDINYKNKKELYLKLLLTISLFPLIGYIFEVNITSFAILKILQIALDVVLIFLLFKANVSETTLLFAINFSIIYLIQEPIAIVFHFCLNNINDYTLGIIGNLVTIIILYIIKKFSPIRKIYETFLAKKYAFKIIIVNLFIIFQIEDYYYKAKSEIYKMNMMFFIICALIILILNFIIIYEENRVFQKEKELSATRINSALMENMINEIRRTQHQYDNRINALTSLASVCKDYDTLKNEILKNTDIMLNDNTDYDVLKLNLKLVAALIFSKINQAKESGITLSIEIKNYSLSTKVPEYDLIDIIGIMINNMLEATPDNSACTLTLNSIDDKILIQTKNEGPKLTTELQNNLFSQGYTTKQNETDNKKRGYGLYNLRKTVLKYGGSFSVMNEYSADRLKTYIVFTVEV